MLALDIGTSSTRSALYGQAGNIIAASLRQLEYRARVDASGAFELAPNTLLRAVRSCIDGTLEWHKQHLSARVIRVVGVDCFWHSLIGSDERGRATTNVMTWADTRAASDAEALQGIIDPSAYHARTGCMLHASFWPAKHRWLQRHQRQAYAQTRFWMSPAEWLMWQITGVRQCAHAMATGTGLYSPTKMQWDEDLIESLHIPARALSPISDELIAPREKIAKRWPALTHAPWVPAIGDGVASNLGCGATDSTSAAINYGTSAAVRVVRTGSNARAPLGLFAYRIDKRRFLLGGAISNAGNVYDWARQTLRLPDDALALERALSRTSVSDGALTVLPFWNGERAPYWRDDLCGSITGLRQSTTALDIAAALRQATFHRLALIAEKLPGMRNRTAIVAGGLPISSLQLMANVTGLRLRGAGVREASARGAAVFAIERISGTTPPPPRWGREITPERAAKKRFREARERHAQLEALLA